MCRGDSVANLKASAKGAGINWDFTWGKRCWRGPFSIQAGMYVHNLTIATDMPCPKHSFPGFARARTSMQSTQAGFLIVWLWCHPAGLLWCHPGPHRAEILRKTVLFRIPHPREKKHTPVCT